MTDAQKLECIKTGIGHKPTDEEAAHYLYGSSNAPLTEAEQVDFLEPALKESPDEWQFKVLGLIQQIPTGHLISYGNLARWAKNEYGLKLTPRNTAWLVKKIYWLIGHDTDIPLHRVASTDDAKSARDGAVTQRFNRHKRSAEGSFHNPVWLQK